ncbi:CcdC family protein [Paenibacillus sp. J2TS4]|uniref:CcdC family protein n=1 Tax=Paenibacillus sp. J2TS4 TaxID=2807194 RepID=UPI001B13B333|nr:cytochrome c biogenesis protein CcdC [Paenibacillus sp. J2TS4]GIP31296.1 protein CcdC [Paenibacillus sp. J2TS4]
MSKALISTQILSILISLLAGSAVIFLRLRAAHKPTSLKKIIMPPIGMATGFFMFLAPVFRVPWSWAAAAFLIGAGVFAYPLIRTSKFHRIGNDIYLKRSSMFIVVIIVLLLVRTLLHDILEQYITISQSAGIFFILAFGMLLPWRTAMLLQYRKLDKEQGVNDQA